jgi:iron complex outermembrane receptor protein
MSISTPSPAQVAKRKIRPVVLGVVALFRAFQAQASDATDLSQLSLEELLEVKVESVTAASKRSQLTTDAPASITVVDREQIQHLGYQTLADVLRGVRGFYVSYDRNYSYLGTRGFSRPGDYNSRVLFLVNGQRINDGLTEGALIGNEFVLDVDLIERVEIVRGPGSAMYGSSAFFGVINVITREPRSFRAGEASFEGGSPGYYKGRISLGHRWDNEVEFLLSGTLMNRDGWDSLYYPEFDSPPGSNGRAIGLDHEEAQNALGRVAWKGLTLELGYVNRFKQLPTAPYESVFGDPRNETTDMLAYGRIRLEHQFENEIELVANLAINQNDYDGHYAYSDAGPAFPGVPFLEYDNSRARWIGEELLVRREFWERVTLTGGFEGRQNVQQDQFTFSKEPQFNTLSDTRSSSLWGAYAQSDWKVIEPVTLSLGGRYDQYSLGPESWNPRFAGIWQALPGTTLKAIYGTAFRAPNAYETYYTDGNNTQKTNPDLKPESIQTYELALEQQLGKHFRLSLSAYRFQAEDLINQIVDPSDNLLVYRNVDQARGQGVEAELDARFGNGWRARLGYAGQSAEDRQASVSLSNSPRHIVQGQLIVPLWTDRLTAGIEGRYLSHRHAGNDIPSDPQFVANLTLFSYQWVSGLELSASVYNLFDRHYSDPTGSELTQRLLQQDGRTFRIKLSYAF